MGASARSRRIPFDHDVAIIHRKRPRQACRLLRKWQARSGIDFDRPLPDKKAEERTSGSQPARQRCGAAALATVDQPHANVLRNDLRGGYRGAAEARVGCVSCQAAHITRVRATGVGRQVSLDSEM